ncbi:hypothetical protein NL50_11785 [Clostridium acetobutylicum]|nr:hypothetical protein NL50_11785 [Clostridium acetobutylicum]
MSNKNSRETENRLDELTNLVEKNTRTERHLEQHGDISSPQALSMAKGKQERRCEEINDLKQKILNDTNSKNDEIENTEKRYRYAEGYIDHNADNMNKSALENMEKKQENRRDTLNSLK